MKKTKFMFCAIASSLLLATIPAGAVVTEAGFPFEVAKQTAAGSSSVNGGDLDYFSTNERFRNSLLSIADELREMKSMGATVEELDERAQRFMVNSERLRYDLDGYITDRLNYKEQELYDSNLSSALLCLANGVFATDYAEDNYVSPELHNGNGDAFRHTIWNFGMVIDVGYAFAKSWSDAHEYGTADQPDLEMRMDLYNNGVGLQLGLNNPLTILHSTFVSKSKAKVHGGFCKIISGTSLIWSNSNGEK